MYNTSRVILPKWLWDNAKDNNEFKTYLAYYMQRYPGYRVVKVGKYYAICEINR
jgi:hypothetical protein